jgi:hypothetical protein
MRRIWSQSRLWEIPTKEQGECLPSRNGDNIFLSFNTVFHVPDVRDIPTHMPGPQRLGFGKCEVPPAFRVPTGNWDAEPPGHDEAGRSCLLASGMTAGIPDLPIQRYLDV